MCKVELVSFSHRASILGDAAVPRLLFQRKGDVDQFSVYIADGEQVRRQHQCAAI